MLKINTLNGGGGGNRTRVRKRYTQATTCLGRLFKVSAHGLPAARPSDRLSPLISPPGMENSRWASPLVDASPCRRLTSVQRVA